MKTSRWICCNYCGHTGQLRKSEKRCPKCGEKTKIFIGVKTELLKYLESTRKYEKIGDILTHSHKE